VFSRGRGILFDRMDRIFKINRRWHPRWLVALRDDSVCGGVCPQGGSFVSRRVRRNSGNSATVTDRRYVGIMEPWRASGKSGAGVELGWGGVGVLVMLNPMSIRYPADLPITARREEIVAAIRGNWVLDLATETCSEGSQRDRHFILLSRGSGRVGARRGAETGVRGSDC
jgi:hypothetical protein